MNVACAALGAGQHVLTVHPRPLSEAVPNHLPDLSKSLESPKGALIQWRIDRGRGWSGDWKPDRALQPDGLIWDRSGGEVGD